MMQASQQPGVLVTATTWWPLSARLSSRLMAYGCKVTALCPSGHPLRHLPGMTKCHAYITGQSQDSLARAIREDRPDIVIPTDDQAVQELQQLALVDADVRRLYERSLGSLEAGMLLSGRESLSRLAAKLGIAAAESVVVRSIEQASAVARQWGFPAVLKKDATWGGNGVAIVRNQADLANAYSKLRRPIGLAARCKRRLVNSDRLAFANRNSHSSEMTMQRYVEGTPANAMFAAFEGKLLADYQVRVCGSLGQTGAAVLVEKVDDARIREAGARLAAELGLSGFFGLDFVLRQGTGEPLLIELNPRTTQLGHLPMQDGADLAGHMYAAWTGLPVPRSTETPGTPRIAFFPQAMQSNIDPTLLDGAYMDMPQESELITELQKTAWPERQWIARAYHAFRKPETSGCYVHTLLIDRQKNTSSTQDTQKTEQSVDGYVSSAAATSSMVSVG